MIRLILLLLVLLINPRAWSQKTQITNVRTEIDPKTLELVVRYDLTYLRSGDSIAVRFLADGSRLRSRSVTGDIGYNVKQGPNHQIRWDFIRDGITGNSQLVAEVVGSRPTFFEGKPGKFRLYGLIGAAGLGTYSVLVANQITKDVNTYNAAPTPTSEVENQTLTQLKQDVDRNKTIFYTTISLATVLLIADFVYPFKSAHPSRRQAFQLSVAGGVPSVTAVWKIP